MDLTLDIKAKYDELLSAQKKMEAFAAQYEAIKNKLASGNLTRSAITDLTRQLGEARRGMVDASTRYNALMREISGNLSGGSSSVFNDITSSLSAMTREGVDAEAAVKRLGQSIVGMGAAFLSVRELSSKIVSIRGEFQQLEIAFGTMLGSEEKASTLMEQLIGTAAKTPFDMQGVAQGAKQLLAYGTQAEDVNRTLVKLGDIAAGTSVPLGDLVYLYGTTMTQGRMFTQDLRQFMGRGIPLAAELAKQFNVTEKEVGNLVTKGKVGAKEFDKAIMSLANSKFNGLMERQSASLTGQISNLEDNIDMMFNELGQKSEGFFAGSIESVAKLVEHYKSIGLVILGIASAWGANKAAQSAYIALARTGYDEEISKLQEELGLKQTLAGLDQDLANGVKKGTISSENAQELQRLRGLKIENLQAAAEQAAAEENAAEKALEAAEKRVSASQKALNAANDEVDACKDLLDEITDLGNAEDTEAAQKLHEEAVARQYTAQEELANAERARSAAQTNLQTASETRETAARNLNTASTARNTAATQADTLSKKFSIMWTNALTVATNGLKTAFNNLKAAFASNPIGMAITAISIGASLFMALNEEMDKTIEVSTKYGDALSKARGNLDTLFETVKATDVSSKAHKDAVSDLIKLYEEYGFSIDKEKDALPQLIDLHDKLVEAMENEAIAREKANLLTTYNDAIDKELKEMQDKLAASLEDVEGISKAKAQAYAIALRDIVAKTGDEMRKLSKQENIRGEDVAKKYGWTAAKGIGAVGTDLNGNAYFNKVSEQQVAKLEAVKQAAEKAGVSMTEMWVAVGDKVSKSTDFVAEFRDAQDEAVTGAQKLTKNFDTSAERVRLAKKSVTDFHKELQRLAQNAETELRIHVKFDAAEAPAWMKKLAAGKTVKQLQDLSANFTAAAEKAVAKGQKYVNMNGKIFSIQDAFQRAADYSSLAVQKKEKIDEASTEKAKKEKEKKEKKAEERDAGKAKRKEQQTKDAQEAYSSTKSESIEALKESNKSQAVELMDDGFEKSLAQIVVARANALKQAEDKIEDVAKSLHNLQKVRDGSSDSVEDIKKKILAAKEDSKEFGELIKQYNAAVKMANKQMDHSMKQLFDGLAGEYDSQEQERKDKLKKLRDDIRYLERLIAEAKTTENEELQNQASKFLLLANEQLEWVDKGKEAWNEYYSQYGTFLQKKSALEEKFAHETSGMDVSSPEYKLKYEEYKKNKSALTAEDLKEQIDWQSVFSDIGMLSSKAARMQLGRLNEYTQTDEFRGLDPADRKTITDAISQLEEQAGPQIKGSFKRFGKAVDEYRTNIELLNAAKINEMMAHNQLTEALQKEAAATNAVQEAQRRLAEAVKSGNADNIEEARKALQQARAQQNVSKMQSQTARENADAVSRNTKAQENATKESQRSVMSSGKNLTSSFDLITDTLNGLKSGSLSQAFNSIMGLVDGFKSLKQSSQNAAAQKEQDTKQEEAASSNTVQKSSEMGDAIGAVGESLQAIPNVWAKAIGAILSVLDILGDDMKGGIGNLIGTLLEKIGTIIGTLIDQITNGQFFKDIGMGVWNLVTNIGNGFGNLFGFHDSWNSYRKAAEKYEKLSAVWDELISKKQEYLNMSYGAEALKTADEIKQLMETEQKETRLIGKQYATAWKKGSHSAAKKFDDKMKKGAVEGWTWADVSKAAGTGVYNMTSLFDLSSKQLKAIKEANTAWWVKLDDKTREYLNKIIEFEDDAKDLADSIKERLTNISFDQFRNNFIDAIDDMSSSATDMCDTFEENLKEAIVGSMIDREFKERIQQLYDDFARTNEDGDITKAEYDYLMDENAKLSADMQERKQQLKQMYQWRTDETTSGTSRGFEAMTQDQATELNGRFTAMNEYAASIRAMMQDKTERDEVQWGTLGETLTNIHDNLLAALDIHSNSFLELVSIRENTAGTNKRLDSLSETMSSILRHVRYV